MLGASPSEVAHWAALPCVSLLAATVVSWRHAGVAFCIVSPLYVFLGDFCHHPVGVGALPAASRRPVGARVLQTDPSFLVSCSVVSGRLAGHPSVVD